MAFESSGILISFLHFFGSIIIKNIILYKLAIGLRVVFERRRCCGIADVSLLQNKQFLPKETLVYIRLVEYALQALDIYTINVTPLGLTNVRSAAYVTLCSS